HFQESGIQLDPNWELDCTLPLRLADKDLTPYANALAADGFFVSVYSKRAMAKYRKLLTETTALDDFRSTSDLLCDDIRRLKQPMALIYGTLSPFLRTGELLVEEIPHARFELIEGAGHNFPFNHPLRTIESMVHSGVWSKASNDKSADPHLASARADSTDAVTSTGKS
ncbi:MAG TPA: hypothetical protein VGI75_10210, partial [Pirellulales bacterium]